MIRKVAWAMLVSSLLAVGTVMVSCQLSDSDPATAAVEQGDYYVSFALDDTEYRLTRGFSRYFDGTVLSGGACAQYNPIESSLKVFGLEVPYDGVNASGPPEGDYAVLSLRCPSGLATGTCEPEDVELIVGGVEYDYDEVDPPQMQLTLTRVDPVGGVIEGTFSGTVFDDLNPLVTKTITEGKFSVARLVDYEYEDGTLTVTVDGAPAVSAELYAAVFASGEDPELDDPLALAVATVIDTEASLSLDLEACDSSGTPTGTEWVGTGGVRYDLYVFFDLNDDGQPNAGDWVLESFPEDLVIDGDTEEDYDFPLEFEQLPS